MNFNKPTVIRKIHEDGTPDSFYKVQYLATRLNSADPNDIYQPLDEFTMSPSVSSLPAMVINNGYEMVSNGGKKSRNNRKHKKKSAKKRRTMRK